MFRILLKRAVAIDVPRCYSSRFASQFSKQTSTKVKRSKIEVKTVKMTYKISENDLNIKVGQMSNWLKSKCDVKVFITSDGSPGSKAQGEEIVKVIQDKIPGLQMMQLVKKASGMKFTIRLAGDSSSIDDAGGSKNQATAISMVERSNKLRGEFAVNPDELLDLSDGDLGKKK